MFEMLDGPFAVTCLVTFNALAVKAGRSDWLSSEESIAVFQAHRAEIEAAVERLHEPGHTHVTVGARDMSPC